MTVDEAYELYNETFGSIKKDDISWNVFIRMLFEFSVLSNDEYLDLKRNSKVYYNESLKYNFKYYNNTIPNAQSFFENNFGFESDIRQIINDVETIMIDDSSNNTQEYKKTHDKYGFEKWILQSDGSETLLDIDDIVKVLFKYIIKNRYITKTNSTHLNIFRGNKDIYFDLDGTYHKFIKMYDTIFKSEPNRESWVKYVNFLQDASIIKPLEKNQLIYHHEKNGN